MGYGIKIFVPRLLHYVTRSPGLSHLMNVASFLTLTELFQMLKALNVFLGIFNVGGAEEREL